MNRRLPSGRAPTSNTRSRRSLSASSWSRVIPSPDSIALKALCVSVCGAGAGVGVEGVLSSFAITYAVPSVRVQHALTSSRSTPATRFPTAPLPHRKVGVPCSQLRARTTHALVGASATPDTGMRPLMTSTYTPSVALMAASTVSNSGLEPAAMEARVGQKGTNAQSSTCSTDLGAAGSREGTFGRGQANCGRLARLVAYGRKRYVLLGRYPTGWEGCCAPGRLQASRNEGCALQKMTLVVVP